MGPYLSVVIPAFNEEANLRAGVLHKVSAYLEQQPYTTEVLVVDDGSEDATADLIATFVSEHPSFRLLRNPHRGKAHTVISGVLASEGQFILFTDMDQATPIGEVARLLPWFEQGYDVVVPVASCSLMLKREYPELDHDPGTRLVAERTFDICEYLIKLKKDGQLATDFTRNPGRIAYHIPCHLRDQNIGFKSKELLECAGARVEVIEKCSGHDGAWSAKTEYFPLSMTIAGKAVRAIEQVPADLVASDCPLAGLQLDQAGAMTRAGGTPTRHPIQIIRDAYGLPS